jgi:hypothetical protein
VIIGLIESFDDHRGDGHLVSQQGQRFYFHCVEISDGSRTIPVGIRATAERQVGRLGRDEVVNVTALS